MDLWLNGPEMASDHVPTWVRNVQVEKGPTCGLLLSSTSPLKQTSSFPNSRDYVTFKIPNLQQIWQNAVEGSDARSDHDT